MKKYRHKKLWWIAEVIWDIVNVTNTNQANFNAGKELVEDSNDWELIKEKDWKEKVAGLIYWSYLTNWFVDKLIVDIIEKHMPKITQIELDKLVLWSKNYYDIIDLLKSKWLYSE